MFQSLPGNSKMVREYSDNFESLSSMFQSLPGNSKMVSDTNKLRIGAHHSEVSIPSREF